MLFWKNAINYSGNRISIYVLNVYVPNAELFLEEYMFCIILQSVKMSLSIYNNGKSYHNVEKVVKPIFGYMFELHKVGGLHKPMQKSDLVISYCTTYHHINSIDWLTWLGLIIKIIFLKTCYAT